MSEITTQGNQEQKATAKKFKEAIADIISTFPKSTQYGLAAGLFLKQSLEDIAESEDSPSDEKKEE